MVATDAIARRLGHPLAGLEHVQLGATLAANAERTVEVNVRLERERLPETAGRARNVVPMSVGLPEPGIDPGLGDAWR